mgnify:CR=1 FL=1
MLVKVCTGKTCSDRMSKYILDRLNREKEKADWGDNIQIEPCTCQGNCAIGPTVLFDKEMLSGMNPVKASEQLAIRIKNAKKFINK